jgi:hypothetical protein
MLKSPTKIARIILQNSPLKPKRRGIRRASSPIPIDLTASPPPSGVALCPYFLTSLLLYFVALTTLFITFTAE